MNEGLRVSMGGHTWARMRNSCAATCVAAELLRAESQLETLAAGARADVIVLDGDPLEGIGLLADLAAHMPAGHPGRCRRPAALTCGPVQLPRPSSDKRG
jgi:cytosine/adenosine deaminase-related metal-dependent hydrolase